MKTVLAHPVYARKVKEFSAAWLARFGSGWVELDDLHMDKYFKYAATKLWKVGKLESKIADHVNGEPYPKYLMRFVKDK